MDTAPAATGAGFGCRCFGSLARLWTRRGRPQARGSGAGASGVSRGFGHGAGGRLADRRGAHTGVACGPSGPCGPSGGGRRVDGGRWCARLAGVRTRRLRPQARGSGAVLRKACVTPEARASEGIRPSLQRFAHPPVHRVHWVHRVHVHRFKVPRRRKASAARACATEGLRDSGSPFLARLPPVTAALRPPSRPPGPLGPPGPRPPTRSPMTTEGVRRASLCDGRRGWLRTRRLRPQALGSGAGASGVSRGFGYGAGGRLADRRGAHTGVACGPSGPCGPSGGGRRVDGGRWCARLTRVRTRRLRPQARGLVAVLRQACVTPEARSSQGSRPSPQRFAHPPVHRVHWVHRVHVHRSEVP